MRQEVIESAEQIDEPQVASGKVAWDGMGVGTSAVWLLPVKQACRRSAPRLDGA